MATFVTTLLRDGPYAYAAARRNTLVDARENEGGVAASAARSSLQELPIADAVPNPHVLKSNRRREEQLGGEAVGWE